LIHVPVICKHEFLRFCDKCADGVGVVGRAALAQVRLAERCPLLGRGKAMVLCSPVHLKLSATRPLVPVVCNVKPSEVCPAVPAPALVVVVVVVVVCAARVSKWMGV
jgi:hypothetical protein